MSLCWLYFIALLLFFFENVCFRQWEKKNSWQTHIIPKKNKNNTTTVNWVLFLFYLLGKYTPQYMWLEAELEKVNRSETPWLIVLVHSPWYNSYNYHYMEGETMRVMFEQWFVQHKVDVVFSGHVHAYERSVSE